MRLLQQPTKDKTQEGFPITVKWLSSGDSSRVRKDEVLKSFSRGHLSETIVVKEW